MASQSLDYLNPFMSATIVTVDGDRFPLWLKTDPASRSAARLRSGTSSLCFLSEMVVEIQLAYLPIIKATLTPPYDDAVNFLDSALIEWGQAQLEVQFGYIAPAPDREQPGGRAILSNVFTGILLKPEVQLGPEVVITLNAQGVGGFAAAQQEGNFTIKTTRQRIVKALMQRFGVTVDDSEILKSSGLQTTTAGSPSVADLWTKAPYDFAQAGDSFWTATLKVLRDVGFFSYLIGNTLKVLPASYVFGSAPTKLYRLYNFSAGHLGPVDGGAQGPNRVVPILSVSTPTAAVYLPGSAQGFYTQDVDSSTRQETKTLVGDKQVAPPRTDKGGAAVVNNNTLPAVDSTTGEGAEMYPGDPSDPQFMQRVQAEYQAETSAMGIQLTMETVGDPTQLPGEVVAVRGIGTRLEGNYSVFKVTHTIGLSGYSMSLECVSNVAKAIRNTQPAVGPEAPQPTLDEQGAPSGNVTINPKKID